MVSLWNSMSAPPSLGPGIWFSRIIFQITSIEVINTFNSLTVSAQGKFPPRLKPTLLEFWTQIVEDIKDQTLIDGRENMLTLTEKIE